MKFLAVASILFFAIATKSYAYSSEQTDTKGNITRGAKEWADNCSRCHNLRAPTEFSAAQWRPIMLHMRLQAGLTGQETRDIYAFLAAQSQKPQRDNVNIQPTNQPIPKQPEKDAAVTTKPSGKIIYQQTCIACHRSNGKGALPGVPDLGPVLKSTPDKVLFNRVKNGFETHGSTMAMPPKGGNLGLSDNELQEVLNYMKKTFTSR